MKTLRETWSHLDQRATVVIVVFLAISVLVFTWVGIRQSRVDSYQLLVRQGAAFTTALSEASRNAIEAEQFYDRLAQRRYADLVTTLLGHREMASSDGLHRFVAEHDLLGVWIFERDTTGVIRSEAGSARIQLPEFVRHEADTLALAVVPQFVQLMDEQEERGEVVSYYLQLTDSLNRVVIVASDGRTYQSALQQTGIGFLSQRMAREEGVEYIIYQTTDGIVFASRKPGELLAIESDPFLQAALKEDTTSSRIFEFQGEDVLELVHPFSTVDYPQGVFRVGLSLRRFTDVVRGFDIQMIILSVVLIGLVVTALLYLNSRRRRQEISREYSQIKSLTDRIFEQMETGVAVIGREGVVQFANQGFERAIGRQGIVGKRWDEVSRGGPLATMGEVGEPRGEEEVDFLQGAQTRKLLVVWSRMSFDEGATALVLVVSDVTRLRTYEQAAARRERLSEMGNLAAGVAHEIRNPLNTISIAAQRLASEFIPQERHEEFAQFTQSIRSETKRLNDIITRFLALAREEKKRTQRLELREIVEASLALSRVEAEKLGITLRINIPAGVMVEADPDGLKQVFLNLFVNAREAASGTPIEVKFEAERTERSVLISVTDTGPGIPIAIREQVFAPYFTTKEAGTGLGLPTVFKIISEMGGNVTLDPTYTAGARFLISLPILEQ